MRKVNSSTGSLQVISVDSFVFQHHPDDIDHLTTETDERLRLGFAFGYLFFEICSGSVIAHS